ncbi:basic proline-rich protein-like [Moschus berezovskii]|uniref:basic proline-rich protein-like n=1 Tax=Moschus berezovskii TaxID=68408 RepID=UPI00244513E9|nr:basic proline-rich protein-like [Moschus berezovskii]
MPPASAWTRAPRRGCSETLRFKAEDVREEAGPAVHTVRSPPAPGPHVEPGSWPGGPALTSASSQARSLPGAPTHTRQHLRWDEAAAWTHGGPPAFAGGLPAALGSSGRAVSSVVTAGVPSVTQLLQDCGSHETWMPPLPPHVAGRGPEMQARQFPPEPQSPHLKRAVVAYLPLGGEVNQDPHGAAQTPRGPTPSWTWAPARSPHPSLAPRKELKTLPSYQPGPLPEACLGAEGCPVPRGPRLLGTQPPPGKEALVSLRLLSGFQEI